MSLSKGLVLHLPLEQELYNSDAGSKRFTDKSGYGNHGVSANAGIGFGADRMGQSSRATVFDGTDYIDCGNDSSLNITNAITMCAWIKSSTETGDKTIVCRDDAVNRNYSLTIASSFLQFYFWDAGAIKLVVADTNIVAGMWYHSVATYNGAYLNIYVAGMEDATPIAYTGNIDNDNVSLSIGAREDGKDRFFTGNLADLRIYNRALSTTEIELLYQSYRI